MPRSTLSKRQRKLVTKRAARPARAARIDGPVAAPVSGLALAADNRAWLEAEEQRRASAAKAVAAQEGDDTPGLVAGGFDIVEHREHGIEGRPLRATSRDGLVALLKSGTASADQVKAGLAFRLAYEASAKGLGSGLGNAGAPQGGGSVRAAGGVLMRSAVELHRAYLMARLNQMERAVAAVLTDGRELHAVRMIAGEGHTVREVAGSSGHARAATTAALLRALDAIAGVLRITGQ